jgi:ABC-type sugar transport system ATPase subunit
VDLNTNEPAQTEVKNAIEVRNLNFFYGSFQGLKDINLDIEERKVTAFIGPSGCGKSTLLRTLNRMYDLYPGQRAEGEINFYGKNTLAPGEDLNLLRSRIGMVFQKPTPFPMSIYENIAFGLRIRKLDESEIDRRVRAAADKLDLVPLLERKPSQLSGGQRQRVAIGRAIVRQPKAFLFDEPLSNLDAKLRGSMRLQIARLHKELGVTIVYVTHDQVEAMTLADRIIVLDAGIIQQVGTPLDLYYHPLNVFVATFIGSPPMNLIQGHIQGSSFVSDLGMSVPLPSQHQSQYASAKGPVLWGVRAENFMLAEDSAQGATVMEAKVIVTETLGPSSNVLVNLMGHEIQVTLAAPARPHVGDVVRLSWQSNHLYLFDQSTGGAIV